MTPEKQAERIIAKYPDSLTIPQKDWWHENITAAIRAAVHTAEIKALEWARVEADKWKDGRDAGTAIWREIERRKTL